jgi:xylulokinase
LLEGVAFSLTDTLEVMRPLAPLEKLLSIGGGSKSDLWLGIVGSVLGVKLERPDFEEGLARGAAVVALVGAGVYPNVAAALGATAPKFVDFPTTAEPAYKRSRERYRAAYPAIKAPSS